jgi:hypothetical protein
MWIRLRLETATSVQKKTETFLCELVENAHKGVSYFVSKGGVFSI